MEQNGVQRVLSYHVLSVEKYDFDMRLVVAAGN
jgi:hypothetical protein